MTTAPDLPTNTQTSHLRTLSQGPRLIVLLLASLSILIPAALMVMRSLPLVVQGISAIGCGLAVLLCGSYLLGQALELLTRSATGRHG